jgi:hypothetical protein
MDGYTQAAVPVDQAEERMLDELLDRISNAGGAADQEDPVGAGEDRGPLMPKIDPLFGFLNRGLAVWVLIALLALNRHDYYRNA